ncbi:MAG: DUF2799 domain-containing protein [Parvularculaceae bacterium]|jgi:hypothetical protein|nr:DUF2799 domain-containing protein [Parvularculaceae bacterium]
MRWVVLGSLFALAACASDGGEVAATASGKGAPLSKCADLDWVSLGQRDGLYGEAPQKLDERAAECAGPLLASNTEDYHRGWTRGLATYCTPDAGYDAGRNGRDYRGVCAGESEDVFLAEYQRGRRLFDMTDGLAKNRAALATARANLASDRFELKRELDRVADIDATPEDKGKAIEKVANYRLSISRLEDEIPRLEAAIEAAETALKAHQPTRRE